MSTPSCFLLFLLCLSLLACSARRLGAVDNKNLKIDNELHFSIEKDMKNGFESNSVVVLQAKSSSYKESRSIKEESIEESHAVTEVNHKTEENEKKSTGASVSWRVPHRKHGEKHPGFNLDYSPPKTHPPSHN